MAAVGLLFVSVVLIVNGLMLLGIVDARSAGPLNLFVGALQVLTPTYLIFSASGTPAEKSATILFASGIYLFGFTYLYVGINLLANLDGTGLGWYSIFVTACAVVVALLNFTHYIPQFDTGFGVIWLYWAFLWALFWVVLGLKREEWTRYTGAIAIVAGVVTAGIPAFLLLTGAWSRHLTWWTTALVILEVLSVFLLYPLRSRYQPAVPPSAPIPSGPPEAPEGVPVPRTVEEARRGARS
jgi:putative amide transporter protein